MPADQGDAVPNPLIARLRDENEQLRTALEAALEEHGKVSDDRENLLRRVAMLTRELRVATTAEQRTRVLNDQIKAGNLAREKQNHTEEELRVAFEELQVLAEELEVANNTLAENNLELERRVMVRTGDLAAANASLSATQDALRAIADLVPDMLWRTDRFGSAGWYNKRWYDYTGQTVSESLGSGWLEFVHPEDLADSLAAWKLSIAEGVPFEREHRLRAESGEYRWFLARAEPLSNDRGEIVHWFGSVTDIHERRAATAALEQSELRQRSLIEGMPQLVWHAVDGGKWTWSSPQWTTYTGLSEEASRGDGWLEAVHPDDRPTVVSAWERAAAGDHFEIECRIRHVAEGRHRHFRCRAIALRTSQEAIPQWTGTCTDVDDLLQLQAQQGVLLAELQHRTRNLMAVIQSITFRTLDNSPTLDAFRQSFSERLRALGRVQSLLSRREGAERVTFDALIREEIMAHVKLDESGAGRQVVLAGLRGSSCDRPRSRRLRSLCTSLPPIQSSMAHCLSLMPS